MIAQQQKAVALGELKKKQVGAWDSPGSLSENAGPFPLKNWQFFVPWGTSGAADIAKWVQMN